MRDEVNASGLGCRTNEQVKKQLSDQKTKVRAKEGTIRRERQMTGEGPPSNEVLSPIEEKLVSTMNPQLIVGIISDGETEALTVINNRLVVTKPPTDEWTIEAIDEITSLNTFEKNALM